jgi:hypothetical protein
MHLRATAHRLPWSAVPAAIRAWAGDAVVIRKHTGGMSPGCATTPRLPDGRLVFVKAVGTKLNPQTVQLFRYEREILRQLPPAPHRPALLAAYDRDGWVALLLEHVEGRHPDLTDDADFRSVWSGCRAGCGRRRCATSTSATTTCSSGRTARP